MYEVILVALRQPLCDACNGMLHPVSTGKASSFNNMIGEFDRQTDFSEFSNRETSDDSSGAVAVTLALSPTNRIIKPNVQSIGLDKVD